MIFGATWTIPAAVHQVLGKIVGGHIEMITCALAYIANEV